MVTRTLLSCAQDQTLSGPTPKKYNLNYFSSATSEYCNIACVCCACVCACIICTYMCASVCVYVCVCVRVCVHRRMRVCVCVSACES